MAQFFAGKTVLAVVLCAVYLYARVSDCFCVGACACVFPHCGFGAPTCQTCVRVFAHVSISAGSDSLLCTEHVALIKYLP